MPGGWELSNNGSRRVTVRWESSGPALGERLPHTAHLHKAWGQGAAVSTLLSEDWGLQILGLDFTAYPTAVLRPPPLPGKGLPASESGQGSSRQPVPSVGKPGRG